MYTLALNVSRWFLAVSQVTVWYEARPAEVCWLFGWIAVGAAFGTSKAGIGIAGLGTFKPELIMKVCVMLWFSSRWRWNPCGPLVPHSCCYVRYHCSIRACSVSFDCRRTWVLGTLFKIFLVLTMYITVKPSDYSLYAGFIHLGAGLACGFTGLAAGYAIGYVGDSVCQSISVFARACLKLCSFSVYEHTFTSQKYSCLWFSSSSSEKFWVFMGSFYIVVFIGSLLT